MPVFCMAIGGLSTTARLTRSAMLEVTNQDYIRTAWSKGLRERTVIMRHALKNGLIPIVTVLGMGIGGVFAGSVIVETDFCHSRYRQAAGYQPLCPGLRGDPVRHAGNRADNRVIKFTGGNFLRLAGPQDTVQLGSIHGGNERRKRIFRSPAARHRMAPFLEGIPEAPDRYFRPGGFCFIIDFCYICTLLAPYDPYIGIMEDSLQGPAHTIGWARIFRVETH